MELVIHLCLGLRVDLSSSSFPGNILYALVNNKYLSELFHMYLGL